MSLILVMMNSSCEETDVCDQMVSPRLNIVFKDVRGDALVLDTLYVYRDGNRSPEVMMHKSDSLHIALNADKNETRFEFRRKEDAPLGEILITAKNRERQYISIACGFKQFYKDVTYDQYQYKLGEIERVIGLQSEIVDESSPHLEIRWQD